LGCESAAFASPPMPPDTKVDPVGAIYSQFAGILRLNH
jgi:hypothetical protein